MITLTCDLCLKIVTSLTNTEYRKPCAGGEQIVTVEICSDCSLAISRAKTNCILAIQAAHKKEDKQ